MGEVIVRLKGGLGNQLFQYASANAFCKEKGLDLFFDLSFFQEPKFQDIYRLQFYPIEIHEISTFKQRNIKNYIDSRNQRSRFSRFLNFKNDVYKIVNEQILKRIFNNDNHNTIYLFDDWFVNPSFFLDNRKELSETFVPINLSEGSKLLLQDM
ncbi:MAG: hypothetical protein JJU02_04875, partial [Cryomorphaceae bacterium]|nr:hypothetical protein [Cryomorphaceae bacterium]